MNTYNTECVICFKKTNKKIIVTECKHFICLDCFLIGGYNIEKCPLCRLQLKKAYLYEDGKLKVTFGKGFECPCCYTKKINAKGNGCEGNKGN